MCGFTGWVDFKKDLRLQQNVLHSMTKTLKKRGPDAENLWTETHVAFGHQRLIVIDPSGGEQPMTRSKKGTNYTLAYNGELYNTDELRRELQKRDYHFSSNSDTEVLLISYIEWQEQCVDHLNGIFAFAIWDDATEKLFIARDRLGVKPLFYTEHNSGLLFGSEIKALLAHPEVQPIIKHDGLADVFSLGPSRTPGNGIFHNINELRPAHALTFTKGGLRIWRYWNVKSSEHIDSFDHTVTNVRDLVTDAVERQLVSDVPLCTFLSGGLDSSIITAIAANKYKKGGNEVLHTYSIDYEDNAKFFESNDFQLSTDAFWIQKMTDTFKTVHHSEIITQQQLIDHLKEAVHVRDVPGMADVDSSLLWFAKVVKRDFTVGLSGECADEIFGGYPWFKHASSNFPWIRSIGERESFLRTEWQQKLNIQDYMQNAYEESIAETPRLDGEAPEDAKRRELFYLNMNWFMSTLLERKDRMSMGAGLEVRVPFADHRLVEYMWNIPWEMKSTGNMEKGLLRKAMEDLLPKEVLYRQKNPYPKTYHPAYTAGVQQWLKEILQDKNSILHEFFERKRLESLIDSGGTSFKVPWFGQLMAGPQLLAYLAQIHTWFEDYQIQIVE
ncbi:asparagine synthase (glutamine-hydrolyzing) [Viridibacillus sp. YIM B01967]|uniref:asparagine synthase (glutamine-hydrolyzing) n=1 Tax=Viridibacillus soli TaxID=2798301 RepID=A0ABS1H6L8_9BACL|nr:asparagine synthase (glutamine-hydrolyzing) [Viridibacillus soli]MBK3494673.1 asparagine synthase (glutamine-hydrolyzing) [Viridibacillus soli]